MIGNLTGEVGRSCFSPLNALTGLRKVNILGKVPYILYLLKVAERLYLTSCDNKKPVKPLLRAVSDGNCRQLLISAERKRCDLRQSVNSYCHIYLLLDHLWYLFDSSQTLNLGSSIPHTGLCDWDSSMIWCLARHSGNKGNLRYYNTKRRLGCQGDWLFILFRGSHGPPYTSTVQVQGRFLYRKVLYLALVPRYLDYISDFGAMCIKNW